MTTLADTLGSPPAYRLLPAARSPEWAHVCKIIEHFCELDGVLNGRGPGWLWARLQGSAPPYNPTWGGLLRGHESSDPGRIRAALRESLSLHEVTVVSWNLRWLVNPDSDRAAGKKRVIEERLQQGHIVCIQETHWTDADAAVWEHSFLLRAVRCANTEPERESMCMNQTCVMLGERCDLVGLPPSCRQDTPL